MHMHVLMAVSTGAQSKEQEFIALAATKLSRTKDRHDANAQSDASSFEVLLVQVVEYYLSA